MNRVQFINSMQKGLYPLEAQERKELISDYEQHFDIGLSEGKSEEEIALELGRPEDLIKEILGDRYSESHGNRSQVQWSIESSLADDRGYRTNPSPRAERLNPSSTRRFFTTIGLLFLNLMIGLPIFITIWSLWVSIAAVSISGSLAPILAVLDFTFLEKRAVLPELFVSITLLGVGILVGIFALWLMKQLAGWTAGYYRWNINLLKGRIHKI